MSDIQQHVSKSYFLRDFEIGNFPIFVDFEIPSNSLTADELPRDIAVHSIASSKGPSKKALGHLKYEFASDARRPFGQMMLIVTANLRG